MLSHNPKKFHHLNEFQRGQIEALLKLNLPKTQIAKRVGISRSTLYHELKRGTTTQMNSDRTFREEYFDYTGQAVYKKHRKNCRRIRFAVMQNSTNFLMKLFAQIRFIVT